MDKIVAGDPLTRSADIIAENIDRMKALFPDAFTEGKVDFEVLKQLLGGAVDDAREKYGLTWHGKRQARRLALTPSMGTLRPCPEESFDWDTTRNLMIEGDNLEVLKLLLRSYAGKVKMIYIDPPYNTGKDFVYPDDYHDGLRSYLKLTGQVDGENRRLSSNMETSGRFHTDWLNMIYPRIKVARNLLRQDGVLLCHMDEHEQSNLEKILEEVFGSENFLGTIVWDKRNPKGDATGVAYQHEILLLVAKDKGLFLSRTTLVREKKNATSILSKAKQLFSRLGQKYLPDELDSCARQFNFPTNYFKDYELDVDLDSINREFASWIRSQDFSGGELAYNRIDENGDVFRLVSMAWPNKKKAPDEYFIPLKHPVTGLDCPVPMRGWRNPPATMQRLAEAGDIVFGKDHTIQPQRKYMLKLNLHENFPSVVKYGGSDDAVLRSIGIPFDTVKPVEFGRQFIAAISSQDDIVIDFFAGSGTTAHAVMMQNAVDGGNRRYILVQLPVPLDSIDKSQKASADFCDEIGKPRNVAELTKERLRRAAKKIRSDNPAYSGDLGFRVFKLDTSNVRAWDPTPDDLDKALLEHVDQIKPDRSEQDILHEILLKLGFDLCVPIETRRIAGKPVRVVGAGALIVCLDTTIGHNELEPLTHGIADWYDELAPAGGTSVIFRDSAFSDDVAKANIVAILDQRGISSVRSL